MSHNHSEEDIEKLKAEIRDICDEHHFSTQDDVEGIMQYVSAPPGMILQDIYGICISMNYSG